MIGTSGSFEDTHERIFRSPHNGWAESFCKSAVEAQSWSDAWASNSGNQLANAFLRSLRPTSVLDAVARYAIPTDERARTCQLLSGASADTATEGAPRVATHIDITAANLTSKTTAAIVAMTSEVARSSAAGRVIGEELRTAVSKACNTAFLSSLTATAATTTATTATGKIGDLLAELPGCNHIVVAAPRAFVRGLALEVNDGRISPAGGELFEGCTVIATDAVTGLVAVPADRIVLRNDGLSMVPAIAATVQLDSAPVDGEQPLLSLWEHNMRGLRVERSFAAYGQCVTLALS